MANRKIEFFETYWKNKNTPSTTKATLILNKKTYIQKKLKNLEKKKLKITGKNNIDTI